MNSLETEYSFLAPTWKLPSIGTTSMYSGTYGTSSYSPSALKLAPDESTWNNTMYNSRYIPPSTNRRTIPQTKKQQPGGRAKQSGPPPQPYQQRNNEHFNNINNDLDLNDMPIQSRNNGYPNHQIDNQGLNYPPPPPSQPTQKRVQIIDHNRQTPSTDYMSGKDSRNSYSYNNHTPELNQIQQKPKPHHDHTDENKSVSTHNSLQRSNNFNVHEYLYGLSAPDPGSYVSAYKNQRRRLEDEKVTRKSVMTNYKTFVQNGGFGPAFGGFDHRTYEEKLDTEKKRKSYSKVVREVNQYKVEEQKRFHNNGGQQRDRTYAVPIPKIRRPDAMRSHFLSAQEVRDFEQRIKREHDANCKCSLHANPHHSSA